jgi:cytochrome c-type biogenesis protein CcmH
MRWSVLAPSVLAPIVLVWMALSLTGSALTTSALAVEPGEQLTDPRLEARARALSTELRCLVCQNQSIDDSNAPLAKDLRMLVREQITAGKSDNEVIGYVVARYGEFVLLRPRFTWSTALLWLAPLLLLGGTGFALYTRISPTPRPGIAPLTTDEEVQLKRLIDEKT